MIRMIKVCIDYITVCKEIFLTVKVMVQTCLGRVLGCILSNCSVKMVQIYFFFEVARE